MCGLCVKNKTNKNNVKLVLFFIGGLTFSDAKNKFSVSEDDLRFANRYANEKDKVLHLVSAYLKNKHVGKWTVNEYGKPVADGVCFNISHCDGAVALVLSDKDVGVDIEKVRRVEQSLIDYVSSESEKRAIKSDEDFFRLWTAKESLAKAQGKGLVKDVKTIPAFPFDGAKEYLGESYYSRQTKDGEYIITVSRKGKESFELEIVKQAY